MSLPRIITLRAHATIREQLHVGGEIDDRTPYRDGNSVLARVLVVRISGAGTVYWKSILDSDEVLVVGRNGVAGVSNADVGVHQFEFEGLVLGSFANAVRYRQFVEWVWRHARIREVRIVWSRTRRGPEKTPATRKR